MEKTLYLFFTVLLLSLFPYQQGRAQVSRPDHKWSIGVKYGPSLSFITRTNRLYSAERPNIAGNLAQAYTGGMSFQYFAESNFALQIEGLYTQKGWREIFVNPSTRRFSDNLFYEVTLNYLEVPVTAHGYIGKKNVRIFMDAGLYLGYLLSFDTQRERSITNEQTTYMMRMQDANRLDIGIRGAAGFEIATAVGTFQLGGSYSYGLGSVLKRNLTSIPNMLQNHTITITLGYFVEFGKK